MSPEKRGGYDSLTPNVNSIVYHVWILCANAKVDNFILKMSLQGYKGKKISRFLNSIGNYMHFFKPNDKFVLKTTFARKST
jgi:hypothetical protein